MVTPSDSSLVEIKRGIRRLTASASESALSNTDLEREINIFGNANFPNAIKTDQMRSVYTFFTAPYIDRYPLDVNYNQGVRAPVYVDGIQGNLYKDRQQFFAIWPKTFTQFQPISGDGVTTVFSFSVPGPILSQQVTLGGTDVNGSTIKVSDDGNGNLQLQVSNPVVSVPANYVSPTVPVTAPVPGMKNLNTANPGLNYVSTTTTPYTAGIGTVNYITGLFNINFPVAPASGTQLTLFVKQYQTGRPYDLMFWNNEFTIRPVPKLVHRIEVETYLTPVQFLALSDTPIVNQWAQYIEYGCAMEILRKRQDMAGVEALREGFKYQEGLILERQATEEIFVANATLFNSPRYYGGFFNNWGGGY